MAQSRAIPIGSKTFQSWFLSNKFVTRSGEPTLTELQLVYILAQIQQGLFEPWHEPGFSITQEPDTHDGLCLCHNCGRVDWRTPHRDFYQVEDRTAPDNQQDGQPGMLCPSCWV